MLAFRNDRFSPSGTDRRCCIAFACLVKQALSRLCDTSKLGLNSLPTRLREQRSASFALGVNLSPPMGCYGISAWVSTAWFAHDSALEGDGFEPSVPQHVKPRHYRPPLG